MQNNLVKFKHSHKMKSIFRKTILFIGILSVTFHSYSQVESIDYFGQEPPGYFPEVFAPEVFNETNTWGPVFSPDGNELFYTWQNPDGSQDYKIMYLKKTNGVWSDPELAPFSDENGAAEIEPNFTPDGNRLYFDSERSGGHGGADIWYVERTASGWSDPINAGAGINTSSNDNFPSFSEDGTMYFCSDREKGNWDIDIYYAKYENGSYADPVRLHDSINSTAWEACPTVVGNKLIFESYLSGGYGAGDYYVSQIEGDSYGKAERLSPFFNTNKSEFALVLSPDRKYLFFKHGGETNVYWVDVEVLDYLGVKEAPFNYVAGWYAGNRSQMALALHPRLEKRQVTSETSVSSVSYSWMLDAEDNCFGCIPNVKEGRKEVYVLHESENIATVKAYSDQYYDFLHLVKFDGYWKILNATWDYHTVTTVGDSASLRSVMDTYVGGIQNSDSAEYANLLHRAYVGRLALSHTMVHSVNKDQFLAIETKSASMNNDFTYEILSLHKNIASVKVQKGDSLEYLHLSFQNSKWYIVSALRNFHFDSERNYNLISCRVSISSNNIAQGVAVGSAVGTVSVDLPPNNSVEISIDESTEIENHNDWFYLDGNILRTNKVFTSQDTNRCVVVMKTIVNNRDTVVSLVNIRIEEASDIEQKKSEGAVIYPNPNSGIFTVNVQNLTDVQVVQILDMNSKVIVTKEIDCDTKVEFDLTAYPKGCYSVLFFGDTLLSETRIVLQ